MADRSNPRNGTPRTSIYPSNQASGRAGALDPTAGESRKQIIQGGGLGKVSLLDWLLAGGTIVGGAAVGAAAGAAGEAAADAADAGEGAADAAGSGTTAATTAVETGGAAAGGSSGGLLSKTFSAIDSPLTFLGFIAYLFHPRMILRAVEFLTGAALMIFGLHAALQARGEGLEGFSTSESALTRSGLGRVATELGRVSRGGGSGRVRSAPHRTRQRALQQRYAREEDLQRRRAKAPRRRKS